MLGNVVSLDAHRPVPLPTVRFGATVDGAVELIVRFEDGSEDVVRMSPNQAARLIIQGTDAVEIAEAIARG